MVLTTVIDEIIVDVIFPVFKIRVVVVCFILYSIIKLLHLVSLPVVLLSDVGPAVEVIHDGVEHEEGTVKVAERVVRAISLVDDSDTACISLECPGLSRLISALIEGDCDSLASFEACKDELLGNFLRVGLPAELDPATICLVRGVSEGASSFKSVVFIFGLVC